ncbi:hypothetical protein E2C01_005719 [Portunus trituberculatus]|uniref:Uncharacterized protein n=1 Tax=Portunus trituberculatus TaxID=210409 RepID=A0A5B7CVS4_PORTR|nr:hypothetical protein [Portunus trituberculatus]
MCRRIATKRVEYETAGYIIFFPQRDKGSGLKEVRIPRRLLGTRFQTPASPSLRTGVAEEHLLPGQLSTFPQRNKHEEQEQLAKGNISDFLQLRSPSFLSISIPPRGVLMRLEFLQPPVAPLDECLKLPVCCNETAVKECF